MSNSARANYWKRDRAKVLPVSLGVVLSMSALGVFAQEEAGAAQKLPVATLARATEKSAQSVVGTTDKPAGALVDTAERPQANGAPPPTTGPGDSPAGTGEGSTSTGESPAGAGAAPIDPTVPLRNAELLNRLDEDRLPTRPRRFLKLKYKQVRRAKDEQILQLLLVCVGFVGVFVAILALRSVPPSRSSS
jgi:hypothetical protein